jgi:hypothetical protein
VREFSYEGVDRRGRPITGTTAAENAQEVKAQLQKFGFSDIKIQDTGARSASQGKPQSAADEKLSDDYVQKMVDGLIDVSEPPTDQEAEEDEWRRAEVYAKIKKRRRRENIGLIIILIILSGVGSYFIYDKATAIKAPQPQIIMSSRSKMLSFKDVYVKDNQLFFTVFSRDWNGNVRVDFKAWDPFNEQIDFGTARLGFLGEHYGASPRKTSTFQLKRSRYYERIEIMVSGDEGK